MLPKSDIVNDKLLLLNRIALIEHDEYNNNNNDNTCINYALHHVQI